MPAELGAIVYDHSSFYKGVGERIKEAAKEIGTQKEAAAVAGSSLAQFRRYMEGDQCPFHVVVALAVATGKPLNWFITDARNAVAHVQPVDMTLLAQVIVGVEQALKHRGQEWMPPEDKAALILEYYAHFERQQRSVQEVIAGTIGEKL